MFKKSEIIRLIQSGNLPPEVCSMAVNEAKSLLDGWENEDPDLISEAEWELVKQKTLERLRQERGTKLS